MTGDGVAVDERIESREELLWTAELLDIFVSPGHDYWTKGGEGRFTHGIRRVETAECVAGRGIRGDRYFMKKPGGKGQVTFLHADVVDAVRERFRLPRLPASVFRRNVIVRGVRLSEWLNRRFRFQGVLFEGSQECRPCEWMDRVIAEGAQALLRGPFYGGLRARVIEGGVLRCDEVDAGLHGGVREGQDRSADASGHSASGDSPRR